MWASGPGCPSSRIGSYHDVLFVDPRIEFDDRRSLPRNSLVVAEQCTGDAQQIALHVEFVGPVRVVRFFIRAVCSLHMIADKLYVMNCTDQNSVWRVELKCLWCLRVLRAGRAAINAWWIDDRIGSSSETRDQSLKSLCEDIRLPDLIVLGGDLLAEKFVIAFEQLNVAIIDRGRTRLFANGRGLFVARIFLCWRRTNGRVRPGLFASVRLAAFHDHCDVTIDRCRRDQISFAVRRLDFLRIRDRRGDNIFGSPEPFVGGRPRRSGQLLPQRTRGKCVRRWTRPAAAVRSWTHHTASGHERYELSPMLCIPVMRFAARCNSATVTGYSDASASGTGRLQHRGLLLSQHVIGDIQGKNS